MVRPVSYKNFDAILQIVKQFPQGASLEDIFKALAPPLSRRSLQRYLSFLTLKNRLNTSGKARSRRYHLSPKESEEATPIILPPNISSTQNSKTKAKEDFCTPNASAKAQVCVFYPAGKPSHNAKFP